MKTEEEDFHNVDSDPFFIPYRPPPGQNPFNDLGVPMAPVQKRSLPEFPPAYSPVAKMVRKDSKADGAEVQMKELSPSRLRYTSTWHSSRPRPRLTIESEEAEAGRPSSADYTELSRRSPTGYTELSNQSPTGYAEISRRLSPPPASTGSTEEASLAWGRQRPTSARQRTFSSEQSIDEEDGTDRESNVHRPLLRNESTGTDTFDSPLSEKNAATNF